MGPPDTMHFHTGSPLLLNLPLCGICIIPRRARFCKSLYSKSPVAIGDGAFALFYSHSTVAGGFDVIS